jgi:hypothetical protein
MPSRSRMPLRFTSTAIRWSTTSRRSPASWRAAGRSRCRRPTTASPSPPAAGPRDEVRLAQQRHALRGRAVRRTPGPAGAARPRHTRPLLRSPVRGRLDQQLRLHRVAGHRHRRGRVPAHRPRRRWTGPRWHEGYCRPDQGVHHRRAGAAQRRGRPAGRPHPPGPVHHHPSGGPGRRSPGRRRRRPPARSTRPRGAALVGTVPGGSGGVPPLPPPTSSS